MQQVHAGGRRHVLVFRRERKVLEHCGGLGPEVSPLPFAPPAGHCMVPSLGKHFLILFSSVSIFKKITKTQACEFLFDYPVGSKMSFP